jgi:hypothetical protein
MPQVACSPAALEAVDGGVLSPAQIKDQRFFAFLPRVLLAKYEGFSVISCFSETLYVIWSVTAWI